MLQLKPDRDFSGLVQGKRLATGTGSDMFIVINRRFGRKISYSKSKLLTLGCLK